MKRNNKIGLLVAVMVLSLCTVGTAAYSKPATEGVILTASDSDENITTIKANRETLESAKADMADKKYESAITYLNAYINGKPKKYEGYKLRGECYYALRQYELARQDFQTAVDINTGDDKFITGTKVVGAYVLGADKEGQTQNPELGILYGELMYAQKALNDPAYEESFRKAFEYNSHQYLPQPKVNDIFKINCPQKYGKIFNPQGNDVEIMAVINDIEKGDYHEAAYKLPALSASLPKYYLTHYLTGVVMAGLDQDTEAIKAFEKAITLNPNDFESLASLGQIYYNEAEKSFSKEKANKSIEYFKKAIKLNPNISTYDYYIGLNNLLIGNNDEAVTYFDKAISQRENDYNSMYYKSLAQQIKGDYPAVIETTTKLLNRHVSNYNSVLYLQALAYAKSGNNDAAMENVEKIFAGMNDIYNADIKTTSAKEATLPNYLHYLKAQILEQKGENSKEEFDKAFENPVIKSLASQNGFDFEMSSEDLENQIDYIRTAFDSYGKIIPNANGYRITSRMIPLMPEFVVPDSVKQLSNENVVDLTPSIAQKLLEQDYAAKPQTAKPVAAKKPVVIEENNETEYVVSNAGDSIDSQKEEENVSEGVRVGLGVPVAAPVSAAKGEPMVFTADDSVKIAGDVKTEQPKDIVKTEQNLKTTVVSAAEQKSTEDFNIKYEKVSEPVVSTVVSDPKDIEVQQKDVTTVVETISAKPSDSEQKLALAKENAQESLTKTIARAENDVEANTVESVEKVEQAPKVILPDLRPSVEAASSPGQIKEKFADVNWDEYSAQQKLLVINPEDEVIEFDPHAAPFFSRDQHIAAAQSTNLNTTPRITDDFSQIHKAVKETVETVTPEPVEEIKTVVEETKAVAEETKATAEATVKKAEEISKEPELIIPETVQSASAEVPVVAPKVKQKAEEVKEVVTNVTSAQTEGVAEETQKTAEQQEQWLKDFLNTAEENVEETGKKAKKVKAKKEETVKDFLDDADEKMLAKAKKAEEKQAKLKAKQEAKLLKQEEKLAQKAVKDAQKAERDAQKAIAKEEKRLAAEAQKAERELQKAAKAEEKARLKAEKEVQKVIESESESAAAVTVIEGDRLIKVKNKKDKEHKKFVWWWKKEKSEVSATGDEVQKVKRRWLRKDK